MVPKHIIKLALFGFILSFVLNIASVPVVVAQSDCQVHAYEGMAVLVYARPGTQSSRLGALIPDAHYIATGRTEPMLWLQIDFNGQPGWIQAGIPFTEITEQCPALPVIAANPVETSAGSLLADAPPPTPSVSDPYALATATCTDRYFFTPNALLEDFCPEDVSHQLIMYQDFETGMMIHFKTGIYVLYTIDSPLVEDPANIAIWFDITQRDNITFPRGGTSHDPQEYFGWLWHRDIVVHDVIGTVTGPYIAGEVPYQQTMFQGQETLIMALPGKSDVVAINHNGWNIVGTLPDANADETLLESDYDAFNAHKMPVEALYQSFEHGFAVWADSAWIQIILDDGTYMQVFVADDEPVEAVEDSTPDGLLMPDQNNVIGKAWAQHEGLRDLLGWATATETAYTMNSVTIAEGYRFMLETPDHTIYRTGPFINIWWTVIP